MTRRPKLPTASRCVLAWQIRRRYFDDSTQYRAAPASRSSSCPIVSFSVAFTRLVSSDTPASTGFDTAILHGAALGWNGLCFQANRPLLFIKSASISIASGRALCRSALGSSTRLWRPGIGLRNSTGLRRAEFDGIIRPLSQSPLNWFLC